MLPAASEPCSACVSSRPAAIVEAAGFPVSAHGPRRATKGVSSEDVDACVRWLERTRPFFRIQSLSCVSLWLW